VEKPRQMQYVFCLFIAQIFISGTLLLLSLSSRLSLKPHTWQNGQTRPK